MIKCSVPGCWNRMSEFKRPGRNKAISFHRLPTDDVFLAMKWIMLLNMDIDLWDINKKIRVCGGHFDKECFYRNSRILRPGSVPKPMKTHQGAANRQEDAMETSDDDWVDIDDEPEKSAQSSGGGIFPGNYPSSKNAKNDPEAKAVAIDTTSGSDSSEVTSSDSDSGSDISDIPLLPIFPQGFPMGFFNFPMGGGAEKKSSSEYDSNDSTDYSDEEEGPVEVPLLNETDFPAEPPKTSLEPRVVQCVEKIPVRCSSVESSCEEELEESFEKPEISSEDLIKELCKKKMMDDDSTWMFDYLPESGIHSPLVEYSEDSDEYDKDMQLFAVFLNYYSPRGYNYAEEQYGVVPPKSILVDWYVSSDYQPGFSKEAFEVIAAAQESSPDQLFVHILLDRLRADYQKIACNDLEYVNLGAGSLQADSDIARRVFVFMATCVTKRWKIPLGFLACDEMGNDSEIIPNLIELCTTLLLKTGVGVTGVTMPLQYKSAFTDTLGCLFQYPGAKTNFSLLNQEMVYFPDPADVLETIRFSFQYLGPFRDADGNDIVWIYLDNLIKLQEKQQVDLCEKTRAAQKYLTDHKIHAKLAINTMNKSVADALVFFDDVLQLPEFKGAAATAKFVSIIANSMELLNGSGNKKILCSENLQKIETFINSVCAYIHSLRMEKGTRVVKSKEKNGFLGLIFALKSLSNIYTNVVLRGNLSHIRLDSFTKDPLELLFSVCRSNIYFVPMMKFAKAYEKMATHWQRKDKETGKMVPADGICILHSQNTKATKAINYSDRHFTFSVRNVKLPTVETPTIAFLDNFEALLRLPKVSEYRGNVMFYIGGFIANMLRNRIKCLECVAALSGSHNEYRIVWQKKWQTVNYPNQHVLHLCWLTERMINNHDFEDNSRKISSYVAREMIDLDAFTSGNASHDIQHRLLLIRAVCELYYDIRHYYDDRDERKRLTPSVMILNQRIQRGRKP